MWFFAALSATFLNGWELFLVSEIDEFQAANTLEDFEVLKLSWTYRRQEYFHKRIEYTSK